MRIGKKSSKREKKAMSVSLYANLMFVVVELVMAIVTGSQAVLLDGVYDGIEFVMLLPSIFLIPLLYKPSNEKYPSWHNSDILSEEEKQSDEFPSYYSRDAGVEDG